MKKLFAVLLVLMLLIAPASMIVSDSEARSAICEGSKYNPGIAWWCFYEWLMENWNPLDWDDGPNAVAGDADDVSGTEEYRGTRGERGDELRRQAR